MESNSTASFQGLSHFYHFTKWFHLVYRKQSIWC